MNNSLGNIFHASYCDNRNLMSSGIALSAMERGRVLRNNTPIMRGYPWFQTWLDEMDDTQVSLARAINLTPPKINNIIKGKRELSAIEAKHAAKFFSCTVEEILSGKRLPRGRTHEFDETLMKEAANLLEMTLKKKKKHLALPDAMVCTVKLYNLLKEGRSKEAMAELIIHQMSIQL